MEARDARAVQMRRICKWLSTDPGNGLVELVDKLRSEILAHPGIPPAGRASLFNGNRVELNFRHRRLPGFVPVRRSMRSL